MTDITLDAITALSSADVLYVVVEHYHDGIEVPRFYADRAELDRVASAGFPLGCVRSSRVIVTRTAIEV